MDNAFLKVDDVAELLQLSKRQIYNLCKEDAQPQLPHIKVNGRSLRFRKSDIERWFAANTIAAV